MPENEKLTVQEFAKRAGCSTQRVYQLLNNRLKPFAVVEGKQKYILATGIPEVLKAREKQGFSKSLPRVEQPLQLLQEEAPASGWHEQELLKEIEDLKERLREVERNAAVAAAERDTERRRADEQAATLSAITAALRAEQEHSAELTKALAASQALQAGQLRLAMQEPDQSDAEKSEHQAKVGLFSRIFGKRR